MRIFQNCDGYVRLSVCVFVCVWIVHRYLEYRGGLCANEIHKAKVCVCVCVCVCARAPMRARAISRLLHVRACACARAYALFQVAFHPSRNERDGHRVLGGTLPDLKLPLQLKRRIRIGLSHLDPRIVRRVRPFRSPGATLAGGVPHVRSHAQRALKTPSA